MLAKYKIKPVKGGWIIERPDGSAVDDFVFKDKFKAERRLEIIIAMGWSE